MSEDLDLSIVIPAFNEEKRISNILEAIRNFVDHNKISYEILVVDDGSRDNTVGEVNKFVNTLNLQIIQNEKNLGKGGAIKRGMLQAKGKYILFADADNSTPFEQIIKLLYFLHNGFDIAIGSRALPDSMIQETQVWYRIFLGKFGNKLIQFFCLSGIKDTQCGFKLFSQVAAKEIFSRVTIFGWAFDIECLVIAKKLGYRIKEVPVIWVNDADTRFKFFDYFVVFGDLLKIKYHQFINKK